MTPWRLDGARAVVTGGTKGIGAACVAELADLGAEVWLCARTASDVEAAVRGHRDAGRRVQGVVADVSTEDGREAVVAALPAGPLDVLVNNAGANLRKPTRQVRADEFEQLLRTNLLSAWGLAVALHDRLVAAEGGGRIVNVGSVAAARAIGSSTAIYAASKGAMESLTRFLANEWAPDGVRVNTVAPWYVRTPLAEQVLQHPDKRDRILGVTPMGRVGEPEEVARAVAFLSMRASDWVTGVVLPVDGGFLARGM